MSAMARISDMTRMSRDSRFVPEAEMKEPPTQATYRQNQSVHLVTSKKSGN
jgi:hypothetical protein